MNSSRLSCLVLAVCVAACGSDDDEDGSADACSTEPDGEACSAPGVQDGVCHEQVCKAAGCGNGFLEQSELCDDGNRNHGDGCSADCRSDETCGNGVVDVAVGESCEMAGATDSSCRADCTAVRCGDGIVDPDAFEACDDGANNSFDPDSPCRPNCQLRECGDAVLDTGELCDDGNHVDGDGCSHDSSSLEA